MSLQIILLISRTSSSISFVSFRSLSLLDSATGYFLAQVLPNKEPLTSRPFTAFEREQSSTYRELVVLLEFYTSRVAESFRGHRIRHFTDNMAVFHIMLGGSRKEHLQEMAVQTYLACKFLDIDLEVVWKSRNDPDLVYADAGSRGPWLLHHEYTLDNKTKKFIVEKYKPTLDGMATADNCLVPRYFSPWHDSAAAGRDLFCQSLAGETVFLHPHPDLILKAVRYAERQKARGVICITAWQRHRHANTLFPGGHIPTWAKEILYIYPVFEKHKLQNVSSFDGHISSPCFLARFDFTINNDWSPQNTEESCLWPPSCSNCCDKM